MKEQGFSLLELLVALAILGIVGALVYANYTPTYRLDAATKELYKVLQTARTEAIRRGSPVTVRMEDSILVVEAESKTLARFQPQNYSVTLTPGRSQLTLNALGRPSEEEEQVFSLSLGNRTNTLALEASGYIQLRQP